MKSMTLRRESNFQATRVLFESEEFMSCRTQSKLDDRALRLKTFFVSRFLQISDYGFLAQNRAYFLSVITR
jgi:hypothetical protein